MADEVEFRSLALLHPAKRRDRRHARRTCGLLVELDVGHEEIVTLVVLALDIEGHVPAPSHAVEGARRGGPDRPASPCSMRSAKTSASRPSLMASRYWK